MPAIRLLFLWHMHQPYYKDLVTGEYRLPWVRLHALKDYYGMVKLLDEFPGIHQTFNLVPALIAQIQDYVSGVAHDPFLNLAARPAGDLDSTERLLVLRYLFQANQENMIGRYPRYRELWGEYGRQSQLEAQIVSRLTKTDLTDLQVLSQIAWMDEFFLEDPDVRELVKKGSNYSLDDQRMVIRKQNEFLAKVLPAYSDAARRGGIEISTSPYYHPILPLIYDSDTGPASNPMAPQPGQRFRHPEDAREQIARALHLHEQVFGVRPRGMWPSEGSVSDDVLALAHELGLQWIATDEGVLGRSLQRSFNRDASGTLTPESAETLYRIYRWERNSSSIRVVFRDHALSDLIGFVYSGMPAQEAAQDFIHRLKESAEAVLQKGKDAVISIILDGENAWEYYPHSGREFLRWLYHGIEDDHDFRAQTISEAVAEAQETAPLSSVVPGSWINANFDVWIGSAEDNISWDHLSAARDFYSQNAESASAEQRELAYKELLIAEGSDWNWWYGPEHHSANDRDFDELYRKHLANVYHALGASPPEALALPIISGLVKPRFIPQTAYIHPRMDGKATGYFDWLGAAMCMADRRSSSMHGKTFLIDTVYAGISEKDLYCRVDFVSALSEWPPTLLAVNIECQTEDAKTYPSRLQVNIEEGRIGSSDFQQEGSGESKTEIVVRVAGNSGVEFGIPLALLHSQRSSKLMLRFTVWRNRLPLDALPQEGWIELPVIPEDELGLLAYAKP